MNVLIIAGMQRSGTALTANLLGNRDFSIPQKVTNTYQSDLQQFHREVFRSQGINENGWTTKDEIELKEQHVAKAKAIIAKCDHVKYSFWEDCRITLLLNFWQELLPQGKFLLVYRSPWDVVDSLFRQGNDFWQTNPELAIQVWLNYNQKIIKFSSQFPDICAIANIETITKHQQLFIAAINQKFRLNLTSSPTSIYHPELFNSNKSNRYRPSQIYHHFPEAVELYHILEQQAWQPDQTPDQSWQTLIELTPNSTNTFQDWFKYCSVIQQNQTLHQELANKQSIVYQLQEELEQYYIQSHPTQVSIDQTQEKDRQQYQILVQEACHKYQKANLVEMGQNLKKALTCTPFTPTKTIESWLHTFTKICAVNNYHLDLYTLIHSPEWQQVMQLMVV